MSPVLRASPHERRCSPSSQISPGLLTTEAASHSLSMVSAGSEVFSSKSIAIWSISTGSKPVIEMSRSSSTRSSASSGSSMARRFRSQPAFSVILLSAKSNARFLASLRPSRTIAGTSLRSRSIAAARRPCPNRIVLLSSTTMGTTKPKTRMLSAIWRICFLECVRALRGLGLSA